MRLLESDGTRVSLVACEGLEQDGDDVGQAARAREPVSHEVELGGLVVHVSELYVCASEELERAEGTHLVLKGAVTVANSTLCVCTSASSSSSSSSSWAMAMANSSSGSAAGPANGLGLGLVQGAGDEAMDEAGLVLESERVSHRRCVVDLYSQSKAANPSAEPEIIVDFFQCANCNTTCMLVISILLAANIRTIRVVPLAICLLPFAICLLLVFELFEYWH